MNNILPYKVEGNAESFYIGQENVESKMNFTNAVQKKKIFICRSYY